MSIFNPPVKWLEAPHGYERVWIGIALAWCLVLSAAMPYWHFKGRQTSSGEAYAVTPADFDARVTRFVEANQVDTRSGLPVVQAPPGGDIYMIGKLWQWFPILKLKKGVEYRLHLSSFDYQHGFSLQPMNMNFQVLPGYDHVLTFTPAEAGEFHIICNEFCGGGHSTMTGLIIVEE
ncbi:MAG: cytochrome C oxidase subunit II [Planctomycetes bacterium]|nr:cytochrome C oxidase subunit II [Planctomycetota bacterium]